MVSPEAKKRGRRNQLNQLNNQSRLMAGKETAKWRREERGRRSRYFRWKKGGGMVVAIGADETTAATERV
jgi:hypothetical protein